MRESRVKGESSLPEAPERWHCGDCGHVSETYLTAPNPFDSNDTVVGCENCKAVEAIGPACWKCDSPASIGSTGSDVYRYVQSCYEHDPARAGNTE